VKDPAAVAVDAVPVKFAVIVPAAKLPDASLFIIVDAVFASVAALAKIAPAATLAAAAPPTLDTCVAPCVPVTSPASEPVNDPAEVAVDAFPVRVPVTLPVKLAVIVPAVKLPEPSRLTIVDAVLTLVAALARISALWILAAVDAPTVAIDGFGKLPPKSPPATPVGASPDAQPKVPDPFVARTCPPAPSPDGSTHVVDAARVSGDFRAR
jgi:hypothetical protein